MLTRPKFHKVIKEKVYENGTASYVLRYDHELFKQGSCSGIDTELFFPVEEKDTPQYIIQRLCGSCPIKEACLEWGLAHERYGTWGGTTARTRSTIRKIKGWVINEINLPKPRI
jgi:hypothetical protein